MLNLARAMGTTGSVGSPGCIFEMESILLLSDQQLEKSSQIKRKKPRKQGRCRGIFLLDLAPV